MKTDLAQIGTTLGLMAGAVTALYGAVKGYTEGRNIVTDWIDSRQDPSGFKVRATISKTVIRDDRTEFIKLRSIRANRKVDLLRIDHRPVIVGQDGSKRLASISNYYAMPGRATITPEEMFQIDLMADEELHAHQDHSVVLGYIMEQTRDALFTPPEIILVPPVGSEFAVIEVHFPGHHLTLDVCNKPSIRFYSKDPRTQRERPIFPQSRPMSHGLGKIGTGFAPE